MNATSIWKTPFATPMVEDAFNWASRLVIDGGTGGFIWGPTRTGKTSLCRLLVPELKLLRGYRGNTIDSECIFMETKDRWVMAEGNFWDWQLREFKHARAGDNDRPQNKRHLASEFLKGIAAQTPSGRVIVLVDEAQLLELHELGLFADQFNDLATSGYEMILILVGSYQVNKWKVDLNEPKYSHVRSRFFTQDHRLRGLSVIEDYRRCLKRYDVDHTALEKGESITQCYHPAWFQEGGRVEAAAPDLRAAFAEAIGNPRSFHVPMAFFTSVVKGVIDRPTIDVSPQNLRRLVRRSGFAINYAPDPT